MIRLSSVQGIVLYAMICGRLPFINPQMKVLCNLILNSKIPEIDASDGLFLVLEASSHPLYVYRSYREGAGRVTKHNMVVFDVILRSHIHTHIHLHTHTYTHTYIYIYIYLCILLVHPILSHSYGRVQLARAHNAAKVAPESSHHGRHYLVRISISTSVFIYLYRLWSAYLLLLLIS